MAITAQQSLFGRSLRRLTWTWKAASLGQVARAGGAICRHRDCTSVEGHHAHQCSNIEHHCGFPSHVRQLPSLQLSVENGTASMRRMYALSCRPGVEEQNL
ncbi:hypothetical protein AC1031_006853 [Aphanomyces cochlioides]|nr:hypothetical protein AC1031_006853 [Aphanomyces cochlioides]